MPAFPPSGASLILLVIALLAACGGDRQPEVSAVSPTAPLVSALKIDDLQPGSGPAIGAGQKAVVNYTGWLYETSAPDNKGKQFDSSQNAGRPFSFVVGAGQVIKGWDQGVLGMKVGGRRRLLIPADLGYGDSGSGDVIPPGATLIFDVDLISIE
jgi:FKBP-type peptidyl-prolyl cis-trans isomerase FkpA